MNWIFVSYLPGSTVAEAKILYEAGLKYTKSLFKVQVQHCCCCWCLNFCHSSVIKFIFFGRAIKNKMTVTTMRPRCSDVLDRISTVVSSVTCSSSTTGSGGKQQRQVKGTRRYSCACAERGSGLFESRILKLFIC